MARKVFIDRRLVMGLAKKYRSRVHVLSTYIKEQCAMSSFEYVSQNRWAAIAEKEGEMNALIDVACELEMLTSEYITKVK